MLFAFFKGSVYNHRANRQLFADCYVFIKSIKSGKTSLTEPCRTITTKQAMSCPSPLVYRVGCRAVQTVPCRAIKTEQATSCPSGLPDRVARRRSATRVACRRSPARPDLLFLFFILRKRKRSKKRKRALKSKELRTLRSAIQGVALKTHELLKKLDQNF